jgi:hypothetical protein
LVQAPGFGRQRFGWRKAEKELKAVLLPEAVATGEVRDDLSGFAKNFFVNLENGGDQISAHVSREDKGRFRIAELPPGDWKLVISDANSTLYEDRVSLMSGETKQLTIGIKKKKQQEP